MKLLFDLRLAAVLVVALPALARAPLSALDVSQPAKDEDQKPTRQEDKRTTASEIWTDHLKLKVYPSEPSIAPGVTVSLIVEIEPGARMHVYAPGADNYRVVTLMVAAQRFVRQAPVRYPASEIYLFEPLNERIPVYQKPFKPSQDVTLDNTPEALAASRVKPSLMLTGTLDYQACDDKICFNPVSVPLSWTLALRSRATPEPSRPPTPLKG